MDSVTKYRSRTNAEEQEGEEEEVEEEEEEEEGADDEDEESSKCGHFWLSWVWAHLVGSKKYKNT